jgi:hypothetical protein
MHLGQGFSYGMTWKMGRQEARRSNSNNAWLAFRFVVKGPCHVSATVF